MSALKLIPKKIILILGLIIFSANCFAATYTWTGAAGTTDWNTAGNWVVGLTTGVPGSGDDVQIGVITYSSSHQPYISSTESVSCKSLTFGPISGIILTVDGTLAVTNAIVQNPNSLLFPVTTTLNGAGAVTCASMQAGSNTTFMSVGGNNQLIFVSSVNSLQITGNLNIYSTSFGVLGVGVGYNNANFSLRGGTTTVGGQILTNNTKGGIIPLTAALATFSIDMPTGSALTPVLKLSAATPLDPTCVAASVDFYNNTGGTGTCTVEYAGAVAQTVYTDNSTLVDTATSIYQNIKFSGSGVKTIQTGNLTINGNWTSAGGKIDAVTNTPTVRFSGATEGLTDGGSDSGNGVVFQYITFKGGSTKTLSSGNFSVSAAGILTATASSTVNANGHLTLLSDSTGSASVASIPLGSSVTGNVNVQRFIKGSLTDLSKRGYRLLTSSVYAATVSGINVYSLTYLLNSTYISGAAGGGFNNPSGTTNPSLYLQREDITSSNSGFTAGNYKGVAKLNNTNAYDTGTQKKLTTANVADTTVELPVGNGFMLYYIGNQTNNSTQTGSKVVAPYDYPESLAFTQTGTLNAGTINVRLWFRSDNYLSYTTSLSNLTSRGYCLVGNPYACTINWEKFNRNSTITNSSIYGANTPAPSSQPSTIWVFNPINKQYETYMQKAGSIVSADTVSNINPGIAVGAASNMIASGQGFFIKTSAVNQTLTFTEAAKTTTQAAMTSLNKTLIIKPATATVANPLLRMQLYQDTLNTDEIVISFNNNASNKFVEHEDAEDIGGNGAAVSLSALTGDSVNVSINQLPWPQKIQQTIPLLVSATTSGTFSLKLTQQINLPAIYQVWLKDNYLKDSVNIGASPKYTFTINRAIPATFGNGRFQLIVCENTAISLQLLSFNASLITGVTQVKTNWTVSNEYSETTFTVERSINNGTTFQAIGSLQSSGISQYSFTDKSPVTGQNQYRLMLSDINNTITYSGVVTVTVPTAGALAGTLMIYPNPASSVVNLNMTADNSGTSNYEYLL